MRYRKTEMARAVDLRQRRRALGISAEKLADMLGCADSKHVSAIETGRCAITITKAARAAYHLGAVTIDVEDAGRVVVIPAARITGPPVITPELRPGEAAWNLKEEHEEALAVVPGTQKAVSCHNREALVDIYEQVYDSIHAATLFCASIDAIDPSISVEARERHVRKLAAKGILAPGQETWKAVPA